MKKSTTSALVLIAALSAGHAIAADNQAGKTREQVRAELAEAVRTGDMPAISMTSQKLNELYPNQYPAKPLVTGKTREQVQAELQQARGLGCSGDLQAFLQRSLPSARSRRVG